MVTTRSSMAKSPPQPTRVLRSGKAHCQSSPTKASVRNGIKKPRAKVIRKRKITSGREFKYFLDLPHEIRHQIYLHFVQGTESSDAFEVEAIKKTRRSLLSVCHQVHREFSPLFYRHCTILVHAVSPVIGNAGHPVNHNNATDFGNLFLSTLANYKIQNIRRLSYNLYDSAAAPKREFPMYRGQNSQVNWSGFGSLASVLHTFNGILQSLEELVVYTSPGWWYSNFRDILAVLHALRSEINPGQKATWLEIEKRLVGPEGPLQGWNISRCLSLALYSFPISRNGKFGSFSSTFRKQRAAQKPQTLVLTHFEVTEW